MQQIQAQSLIAAPILFRGELHGFLTVEGTEARIWTEEEKNYVRGAAQLLAFMAPLENLELTIQQVKRDQVLTTEVTRALYSEGRLAIDAEKSVPISSVSGSASSGFLLLLYDPDLKTVSRSTTSSSLPAASRSPPSLVTSTRSIGKCWNKVLKPSASKIWKKT